MANYISDKSVLGSDPSLSTIAKKKEYRDLDLSLTLHPIRKDITPLRDGEAIKNSIRNLLLANSFERPFQPNLGSNLTQMLFEPATPLVSATLKTLVKSVIVEHEPRVRINAVGAYYNDSEDAYQIRVSFIIKDIDKEELIDVKLRRLR